MTGCLAYFLTSFVIASTDLGFCPKAIPPSSTLGQEILISSRSGLSGPAIHPVAVRMVYQAAQAVRIPIIGMGGIMTAEDAVEMILAGATAVAVGTANFRNPAVTMEISEGIREYMEQYHVEDINELIGAVK